MSAAEEHDANKVPLSATLQEPAEPSLTDVIDQLSRSAFRRSLERRDATSYREVIESARSTGTTSS
jgi:hypothetical protein